MNLRGIDFTGLAYLAALAIAGVAALALYNKIAGATSGKTIGARIRDALIPDAIKDSRVYQVHWAPDALALSGDTFANDDADAIAFWSNYSGAPLMVETPGGAVTGFPRP
jgi:hypothetical protein